MILRWGLLAQCNVSRTAAWFETIVNGLRPSGYEVEWIEKQRSGETKAERDAAKMTVAKDIVAKIEDLL